MAYVQTLLWVRVLAVVSIVMAVAQVILGILQGAQGVTYSIFVATFLIMLSVLLFQFGGSIKFYLENESINNLCITVERQLAFWKTIAIFSVLFLLIYAAFQF